MATTVRVDMRTSTQTRTQISPVAMQGLEVLSLPVTSLQDYLSKAAEANPLLELEYVQEGVSFDELAVWKPQTPQKATEEGQGRTFGRPAMLAGYKEVDFSRLTDACSETESLQMHLLLQLDAKHGYTPEEDAFIRRLIECIDDNGYFAGSLRQMAREASISTDEAERLLGELQTFNPRGVGARTSAECLKLQLTGTEPHYEQIRGILENNLDDLENNRIPVLVKQFGLTRDELRGIKEYLRKLDPRPGAQFSQGSSTVYVIPDISVLKRGGAFEVEVTGDVGVKLRMSQEYLDLIDSKALGVEETHWLEERQGEAANVLRNMAQRKRTLHRLGTYLVKAQYDFFVFGPDRLRPLTMQQVADALDVHVSTVSRTVQDKHILTPWGCFPLKFFFSSRLETTDGHSAQSSQSVKARIKAIIAEEDAAHPLSDASITKMLNDEGIEIKRRTVAKYREALGIACQSKRRF